MSEEQARVMQEEEEEAARGDAECEDEKNSMTADSESIDEEVEPKLKYVRMSNGLQDILLKDGASCIAVHPKFVCLGTYWGAVHLLDHQGTVTRSLPSHTVAVNHISIDSAGETIASCSDDGKVHVVSLFSAKEQQNQTLNVGRLVKAVALDPAAGATGGRRLVVGDERLTLYERSGFLGLWRSSALCVAEGHVTGLAWGGEFVAWASTVGVRVYDMVARCSLGLIQWESPSAGNHRCNLRWLGRTLLIAWVDTVRVCVIRKRAGTAHGQPAAGMPEHLVDPVSTFRMPELVLSGVAPLGSSGEQLVLLGVPAKRASRPQLHVVEYRDSECTELYMDTLSLRGYAEWTSDDYRLEALCDEDRLFVVAPQDVVVASPYEADDRVRWLVQHGRYEEALAAVREAGAHCRKHTASAVAAAYLDHLLSERRYEEAARLCPRVFGRERASWQEHVYKFARAHQLRVVAPYLPRGVPAPLDPQVYEMVLYEHLRLEPPAFLALVSEWREPGLYNTAAIINAVLERLLVAEPADKPTLMEALAVLYGHDGKYERALAIYLNLGHAAVFDLIRDKGLQQAVHPMIAELMSLDAERACELLLQPPLASSGGVASKAPGVPPHLVVERLEAHEPLLHHYLHALDRRDARLAEPFHARMVRLYAIFARDRLLPFLKRSDHYPIQEALDICQRQRYYPEMVYLLGRIGDTRVALDLINRELADVQQALRFCQEHDDPDLWSDLLEHALRRPDTIAYLLPRLGGHVDPQELVRRMPAELQVPGLRLALVSTLRQSRLQTGIQEACQKLLVADYWRLHERLVAGQRRGLAVPEEAQCGACHHRLLAASSSVSSYNVLVYNCRHSFHETCLPDAGRQRRRLCAICHPHQPSLV